MAAFIISNLERHGLASRIISPHPEMPNIVASFDCGSPGRHLVLNGHIDVFPVADDGLGWTKDPWGGELIDGKIYGRGVADMKCGTTASIFTYIYLSRIKDRLKGKLTLTAVSDEETFGPYGARYLMEHHPEVHGDALLNGEPSGPLSVRFGEKGPLWIEFSVLAARCPRRVHACEQECQQDDHGAGHRARAIERDQADHLGQRFARDRCRP